MKHLVGIFESVDDRIEFIKKSLIDWYDEDSWEEFIRNQEMGKCQSICYHIESLNIPGVKRIFGEILIDDIHYNVLEDDETDRFTHHWVTIDGKIYEFSKGTLEDYIDWFDIYGVECEDESIYL